MTKTQNLCVNCRQIEEKHNNCNGIRKNHRYSPITYDILMNPSLRDTKSERCYECHSCKKFEARKENLKCRDTLEDISDALKSDEEIYQKVRIWSDERVVYSKGDIIKYAIALTRATCEKNTLAKGVINTAFQNGQKAERERILEKIDEWRDIAQYKQTYQNSKLIHQIALELKQEVEKK